jgi:hypothetical protein
VPGRFHFVFTVRRARAADRASRAAAHAFAFPVVARALLFYPHAIVQAFNVANRGRQRT